MEKLSPGQDALKPLGDVITQIYTGGLPRVMEQKPGNVPVIRLGDISKLRTPFIHECKTFLDGENLNMKKTAKCGDILMIQESGSKDLVGKSFLYMGKDICVVGGSIHVIKHNQNPIYLIHALNSQPVQRQIQIATGKNHMHGLLNRIKAEELKKIYIFAPDPKIQEQIANRLNDLFLAKHELIISLEEMVEVRRRQYEHYKERLLIGGIDRWEVQSLEKIAIEFFSGSGVTRAHLNTGDYPAIKVGDVHNNSALEIQDCSRFVNPDLIKVKRYCEFGDLLMSQMSNCSSKTGKAAAYMGNEKPILGQHVYLIRHQQNPKFLAHMLSSKLARRQIEKALIKGTVVELRISSLAQINVPLPPREEQDRIVDLLDRHQTELMELEKISEGLKEAREKQYRCMSDRILGFKL